MSFTAIIDVTIGIIFVYLVLSLLCTSINEAIASLLRLRARLLYATISRLIDDQRVREAFWSSGLIKSLSRPESALRDSLRLDPPSARAPSYLSSAAFAAALIRAIDAKSLTGDTPESKDTGDLVGKIGENALLRDVLAELSEEAGRDLKALKDGIATWFDQVMERTSGAYKRNLQAISFVVALGIAIVVNADSIAIGRALWFDDTLREQIVQSAFEVVEEGGYSDEMLEFGQIQRELRPLPIGWDFRTPALSTDWYRSLSGWLAKILGLLLTAFAITLGAPFWFDLLSRFVRLRGAGPAAEPRRNGEEAGPVGTRSG